MITVYKSEDRGIRQLEFPALEPGCWVNIVAPKGDEIAAVSSLTGIPADYITTALDPEETSHIETDDGVLLVVINVAKSASEFDFDTVPLGVILTPDYIVTVSLEGNDILPRSVVSMNGFCTYKRTRFLLQILYKTATAFLRYLGQINRRSNQIENNLRHAMKNEELYQLFDLEKSLTYFSAALRSNRVVIERLLRLIQNGQMREIVKMREDDEDLLEDVQIEYNQAYEMVQMYSNVLSGMMDAFASIISNNLNIVMKFLASVTIIISVPTAIASFWGMNVDVPWGGAPFGFVFVLVVSVTLSALSTFWLWRKGML
ncbi:MAG: magnesium transporter CorA family protein [Synergistaceae bacterium]|jgi:magnesium transporter|nr:magnesium transporter CorA family protein [Synergistaceae bacterium]